MENLHKNKFAAFFFVTFNFVLFKQLSVFLFGGEYSLLLDILTFSIIIGFLVFIVFRKRFDT